MVKIRPPYCALIASLALLISACSDGVSPDAAFPFAAPDYLWDSDTGVREYAVTRAGIAYHHSITMQADGTILDIQTDAQQQLLAQTRWNYSKINGRLSGCSDRTLWHLPTGYRADNQVVSAPGPAVVSSCFLSLDAANLIVGTPSDGLLHYNVPRGEWYAMTFPSTDKITALCRDSAYGNPMLFAATSTKGIYAKPRNDTIWSRLPAPSGTVSDLEFSGGDVLFAVIDRSLWYSRRPFDTWTPFTVTPGDGQINDIAILSLTGRDEILFAATENTGVTYIQLVQSLPAQIGFSEQSGFQNIRQLTTVPGAPYVAVGIGDPSVLFIAPQSGVWIGMPVTATGSLTCVAQSRKNGTILIGTDNGVLRFVGAPPVPSGLQGKNVRTMNNGLDGAFYAGTTDGFFRSLDDGASWTRIDGGTVLLRVSKPWQLLPYRFGVGSSWAAADIIRDDDSRLTLTGRVLHHFDEIILPEDAGRYEDAVVVRYAEELPSGDIRPGSYVWTVYFVRGSGAVYVEESQDATKIAVSSLQPG